MVSGIENILARSSLYDIFPCFLLTTSNKQKGNPAICCEFRTVSLTHASRKAETNREKLLPRKGRIRTKDCFVCLGAKYVLTERVELQKDNAGSTMSLNSASSSMAYETATANLVMSPSPATANAICGQIRLPTP